MTEVTEIPVLDAQGLSGLDAGALRAFAEEFRQAYGTIGFGEFLRSELEAAYDRHRKPQLTR